MLLEQVVELVLLTLLLELKEFLQQLTLQLLEFQMQELQALDFQLLLLG